MQSDNDSAARKSDLNELLGGSVNETGQAIYTIAHIRGFSGHGGGHDEQMICRMGSYGSGTFPPFFPTEELAEAFNQSLKSWERGAVVRCWLLTPNTGIKGRERPED